MTSAVTIVPAGPQPTAAEPDACLGPLPGKDMVWSPGGAFHMGADAHYPEAAPTHRVTVAGFGIDTAPGRPT